MGKNSDRLRRAVPARCVACEQPLDSPLICGSCRRLYPADGLNFFEMLGLEPGYDLEPDAVRARYFELVRQIHPDRVPSGDVNAQQLSLRNSARMNQAFQVLLDPVQRAEYLLELAGGKAATDSKEVPQQVLFDALVLREEIEEAKINGERGRLERLRGELQERYRARLSEIASAARALPGDEQLRRRLRGELNALRYYRKLLEQV